MIHSIDVAADFEDSLSGEGRRTWVAVKIVSLLWLVWTIPFVTKCPWPISNFQTALVPNAQTLINFSNYITQSRNLKPDSVPFPGCPRSTDLDIIFDPGASSLALLSKEDVMDLRELCGELDMVCEHARRRGVKIIIDAESRCVCCDWPYSTLTTFLYPVGTSLRLTQLLSLWCVSSITL